MLISALSPISIAHSSLAQRIQERAQALRGRFSFDKAKQTAKQKASSALKTITDPYRKMRSRSAAILQNTELKTPENKNKLADQGSDVEQRLIAEEQQNALHKKYASKAARAIYLVKNTLNPVSTLKTGATAISSTTKQSLHAAAGLHHRVNKFSKEYPATTATLTAMAKLGIYGVAPAAAAVL